MHPDHSDHFDGSHYHNTGPGAARIGRHGLRAVFRWQLARRHAKARWPRWIDDPPQPLPCADDAIPAGHAAITFIGHSTFLIRLRNPAGDLLTLLTDPIFSPRCSPLRWIGPRRVRAPGLALEQLPPIEAVLISHNHYDHLDLPSLRRLHRHSAPRLFTLPGNAAILARAGRNRFGPASRSPARQATELDWWQAAEWRGLRITATPARHFSARFLHDRNRTLWGGFMIQAGAESFLFAGDSGSGPHWAAIRERLGAPGLALLPIGAYEPYWFMGPVHMNPEDAVRARAALGARRAIGMHFGTFQLTDEAIDQPVRDLAAARRRHGLAESDFATLAFGETQLLPLR